MHGASSEKCLLMRYRSDHTDIFCDKPIHCCLYNATNLHHFTLHISLHDVARDRIMTIYHNHVTPPYTVESSIFYIVLSKGSLRPDMRCRAAPYSTAVLMQRLRQRIRCECVNVRRTVSGVKEPWLSQFIFTQPNFQFSAYINLAAFAIVNVYWAGQACPAYYNVTSDIWWRCDDDHAREIYPWKCPRIKSLIFSLAMEWRFWNSCRAANFCMFSPLGVTISVAFYTSTTFNTLHFTAAHHTLYTTDMLTRSFQN